MVAVPGRSKGCPTCRKRKIRCDLQEPQCGQCIKSRRHCEGSRREIAFIHRTPEGILRKVQAQELGRGPAPWERGRVRRETTLMSQLPPQVDSTAIYFDGMLAAFLAAYLPSPSILSPSQGSSVSYLPVAVGLPRRGRLLSIALQAMCMTKTARAHDDKALLMRGMTLHGQALRALQTAIHNPNTAVADETLTAIRVLAMYEMHEGTMGTMGSMRGWTSHEEAVDRLMHLRGSSSNLYESEMGLALLLGARRSAMIRGIQFYKATFFGEDRWCVEPWGNKPKDYIQQLNDIGLKIPAILEDLRTAQSPGQSPPDESFRARIWDRCQHLDDRFNAWYARLLSLFPTSPSYWELPGDLAARAVDIPPAPFPTTFSFLDIRVAESMTMFWALRIILYTILRRLSGNSKENDAAIAACACNIARSAPYLTLPKTGYLGMQWILFPLKVALSTFEHKGWDDEWKWSRDVLATVQNRGIGYGRDIVQAQWGEEIR